MRQDLSGAATFELRVSNSDLQQYLEVLGQSERHWRVYSEGVWAAALNGKAAMRDYKDFLGPYLALQRIQRKDWASFWLRDVNNDAMLVGRVHSGVEFPQTAAKITSGNPMDVEHGVPLLDCHLLLACDKAFFKVLGLVKQEGVPGAQLGRSVLVPRLNGPAAPKAIRRAVEEVADPNL